MRIFGVVRGAPCVTNRTFVAAATIAGVLSGASIGLSVADEREVRLPCNLKRSYSGSVESVFDAKTLVLEGGSKVQLSGVLPDDASGVLAALEEAAVGQSVAVALVRPERTRYGVPLAHVFVETTSRDPSGGRVQWLQATLVSAGLARVWEPVGQSDCFSDLAALEREAIALRSGLWGHRKAWAIDADDRRTLLQRRGSYQRVRGRIVAVARRARHTYLNFGDDWRTDFTVVVPGAVRSRHPVWAKALLALQGKRIEVQGWMDVRNGPSVELERPAQLVVLELEGSGVTERE